MKNILGRSLPDYIEGYGEVKAFEGAFENMGEVTTATSKVRPGIPGQSKLLNSPLATCISPLEKCLFRSFAYF